MRNQTRGEDDCCCLSVAAGVSALQLFPGWTGHTEPSPRTVPTPAHQAMRDYAEDTHLFPTHLRARPCLSCQPIKLSEVRSQPVFLSPVADCRWIFPASLSPVLQTHHSNQASSVQGLLLLLPEWPPGAAASSGRARVGVSPVLPRDCGSGAKRRQTSVSSTEDTARLCCTAVAPSSGV